MKLNVKSFKTNVNHELVNYILGKKYPATDINKYRAGKKSHNIVEADIEAANEEASSVETKQRTEIIGSMETLKKDVHAYVKACNLTNSILYSTRNEIGFEAQYKLIKACISEFNARYEKKINSSEFDELFIESE